MAKFGHLSAKFAELGQLGVASSFLSLLGPVLIFGRCDYFFELPTLKNMGINTKYTYVWRW